jgi:hypothetical protein
MASTVIDAMAGACDWASAAGGAELQSKADNTAAVSILYLIR